MEHFKLELIEYLDYYNNRRIKAKLKGLAACNSQTASPFGCLNNFYFKILSNFLGSLHRKWCRLLFTFERIFVFFETQLIHNHIFIFPAHECTFATAALLAPTVLTTIPSARTYTSYLRAFQKIISVLLPFKYP